MYFGHLRISLSLLQKLMRKILASGALHAVRALTEKVNKANLALPAQPTMHLKHAYSTCKYIQ